MIAKNSRVVLIVLLAATVLGVSSTPAAAVSTPAGEQYLVRDGDWLSKIAGAYYGDVLAYPSIVEATNAKAETDNSYTSIADPDVIEVGQKLWIPAEPPTPGALTWFDLRDLSYQGIYAEPVQLEDGNFVGEPFVEGGASRPTVALVQHAFGHLNRDGIADAAVLLSESSGGSGTFIYLAAVLSQDAEFVNVATTFIGDRTNVTSIAVGGGEITLETVTHGPDDPMCCPSVHVTYTYSLQSDQLVEVAPVTADM
jgi:hypothetical protein